MNRTKVWCLTPETNATWILWIIASAMTTRFELNSVIYRKVKIYSGASSIHKNYGVSNVQLKQTYQLGFNGSLQIEFKLFVTLTYREADKWL